MAILVITEVKRYFDHFEALRGNLVILQVLGCIFVNLEVYGYFGHFLAFKTLQVLKGNFGHFKSKRCFDYFEALRGTLVILQVLGCILVTLEVYEYFGRFLALMGVFQTFWRLQQLLLVIWQVLSIYETTTCIHHAPNSYSKFEYYIERMGVRYWYWQILSLIKWLDCVNQVNHSFLVGGYNDNWPSCD